MTERIGVERIDSSVRHPFFVLEQEHLIEAEQSQKDIISINQKDTHVHVIDIGSFILSSTKPLIVYGLFQRQGRSIKAAFSNNEEAQEVLPEEYNFSITKDQWVEFATWDGKIKARLTMLEDLPKEVGILAEALDPDPTLDASVKLKVSGKDLIGANTL